MNPKVADMASKVGFDVADFTWFDLSNIDEYGEGELNNWASENVPDYQRSKYKIADYMPPSEKMAMIHPQLADTVVTYEKHGKVKDYEGGLVCLWATDLDESPLGYITDIADSNPPQHYTRIQKKFFQNKSEEEVSKFFTTSCLATLGLTCLLNMRAHTTEEVLIAHNAKGLDFINRKRRAKHQPLLYSWNTIELRPSAQVKQTHKGGTHASPSRHKRRAHLRKKKDGSFAWIPEMWVGSIENGLIVHDYVADRELKGQG
jgi:hypothetical protein